MEPDVSDHRLALCGAGIPHVVSCSYSSRLV